MKCDTIIWSNEEEFLLSCSRNYLYSQSNVDIHQIDLDWDRILRESKRNKISPLVAKTIAQSNKVFDIMEHPGIELVQFAESLKDLHVKTVQELLNINRNCRKAGIRVIHWKGFSFGLKYYKTFEDRPFADIDILVEKRALKAAMDLLKSLDFEMALSLSAEEEKQFIQNNYEITYRKRVDTRYIYVDVHWAFSGKQHQINFPFEEVVARTEHVVFDGEKISVLSPEDTLLALCIHSGIRENWSSLKLIVDLAIFLLHEQSLDWKAFIEKAQRMGILRSFWIGAYVVETLLKIKLPEMVLEAIPQRTKSEQMAVGAINQLFRDESENPRNWNSNFIRSLAKRERLSDKIKIVRFALFHDPITNLRPNNQDRMFIRLPTHLSFLYYLVRPFRIISQYGFHKCCKLVRSNLFVFR